MIKLFRRTSRFPKASSSIDSRSELMKLFSERMKFFRRSQTPKEGTYPYSEHEAYLVLERPNGYDNYTLVGDNWLEVEPEKQKPIAILFGFNRWKLGFVTDYLTEFRCAFANRKIRSLAIFFHYYSFKHKPDIFIAWGINEPVFIESFARLNGIKFARMEDGFLRSVSLGAIHSTPYSLAIDYKGIYYNPHVASGLEDILQDYRFESDIVIRHKAKKLISLIKTHGLTKYNLVQLGSNEICDVSIKRKVLVIGQVQNDASIRLGNIDNWSIEEMLFLAKHENPNAEILYRPHPEVFAGFQKGNVKLKRVSAFVTISNPSEPLIKILSSVDHVYTITSLAGFEALIRGVKVTTLGAPFYAGWGLTDDRCTLTSRSDPNDKNNQFIRRTRKLSIEDLVAAVYLLYPRYLASPEDSFMGAVATCHRLIGEMEANEPELESVEFNSESIRKLCTLGEWAILFNKNHANKINHLEAIAIAKYLNIDRILFACESKVYQRIILSFLFGQIRYLDAISILIKRTRDRIDLAVLNDILVSLWRRNNSRILTTHFAWLLEKSKDPIEAEAYLIQCQELTAANPEDNITCEPAIMAVDPLRKDYGLSRAEILAGSGDYEAAQQVLSEVLMDSREAEQSLLLAAAIARQGFDFKAAIEIHKLITRFASPLCRAKAHSLIANDLRHLNNFDTLQFIRSSFAASVLKPDSVRNMTVLADMAAPFFDLNDFDQYFAASLTCSPDLRFETAQAWIILEHPERAIKILTALLNKEGDDYRYLSLISQALAYLRRFDEARAIIEHAIEKFRNNYVYKEALRLSVVMNDGEWGRRLLDEVRQAGLDVGEMMLRKVYYANREIFNALETLRHIPLTDMIRRYYPSKFVERRDIENDFSDKKVLILPNYGPGDEIRFGQIYADIQSDPDFVDVLIGCDPRFLNLLCRSYPDLHFTPIARVRELGSSFDLALYKDLPAYDLHVILDNNGHRKIEEVDKVLFSTDLLAKYRRNYEDFSGNAYLVADSIEVSRYKMRLPKESKFIVGISWRSSLTTFSRNEHYLTIQELAPIFELDEIQFVNLQYDECSEEIDWVERHYPGKLINFSDLDQFQNLDGVASLMSAMDLIITSATTVDALSGSLGCPTWLLSNSSELNWRKINNGFVDVWHNSMIHLEGDDLGSKVSLMSELVKRLRDYSDVEKNVEYKSSTY